MFKISSFVWNNKRNYVIAAFGKTHFFTLPTIAYMKLKVFHLFYKETVDYDCDGVTRMVEDRLTGGRIYNSYSWNFTRVGGSIGCQIYRFGRPDQRNDHR